MALLKEPIQEVKTLQNYIAGEWVDTNGELADVTNPATCKPIARVLISTADEVNSAVEAAKQAFPGSQ